MSIPPVLWAQRQDIVFLKIDLPEIKDPKVDLTETTFNFSGQSNGKAYSVKIDFYKEVEKDSARWHFFGKQASFVIKKKESGPYWPRLTKESGRLIWLKADWDKWVDESDEDEGPAGGDDFANYDSMPDFSQYAGGAGSDDEDESEDDMPSLEVPK